MVAAVIPARGGSKGIPGKNIYFLGGKPLILYTIEAAQKARGLDRIVVSTDDSHIAEVAERAGTEIVFRPAELSGDEAATRPAIEHAVKAIEGDGWSGDLVATLQPTSPFRTADDIDSAITAFRADGRADSLVSVVEIPHQFNPISAMKIDDGGWLVPAMETVGQVLRRQDKPVLFARNGAAVYLTRRERLTDYVFGGRLLPFVMPRFRSLDIDDLEDMQLAEAMLKAGIV